MSDITHLIHAVPGPILVIGASGFVGANLFHALLSCRSDVFGTTHAHLPWRLEGVPAQHTLHLDLLSLSSIEDVMERVRPVVVFNCSSYGAYSFESDPDRIHRTNYLSTINVLELCERVQIKVYVHAGSSSEYGLNCAAPSEESVLIPDSHYAVSKASTAQALAYFAKVRGIPCVNLRLYSLYGPYEDASRLIPTLCEHILRGELPPFVNPDISRDFIYVDDAVEAFLTAAARMDQGRVGESYNVGTGVKVTIRELAELAREHFGVKAQPQLSSMPSRAWDHEDWYANPARMNEDFGWRAKTSLAEGLEKTLEWWRAFLRDHPFHTLTKKRAPLGKNSLSAIVACYRDEQAIPIMYERLSKTMSALGLDYEIIFVNDASPDNTTAAIAAISARDPRVIGIVHSRNFGSQAAFRSGLEIAAKEACVLLDGDLQDPPEMIAQFVEKWRAGVDVVYGLRVKREMPGWLESLYKGFYSLLAFISDIPIPKNAGDFSLIDRNAVRWILRCNERDSFLRGLRAYVGFRQEGVAYVRPERMFGRSTNNWIKNIGWAKKAIFSFSRVPLHLLTAVGSLATVASLLLILYMTFAKLLFPEITPRGITTVLMMILLFGSVNLLGLGLLGEYVGKIMEETKQRPPFIRVLRIERGETLPWRDEP